MNEQINSAAELDALPVGSIVVDAYAATCILTPATWLRITSAHRNGHHTHSPYLPADVVRLGWSGYGDQPQRVQPSREDVARLLAHQNTDWLHGYLGADPATGETHDHGPRCSNWEPYAEDADAVLALFAQQPTVAAVKAEALREAADALPRQTRRGQLGWFREWLRARADRLVQQPHEEKR